MWKVRSSSSSALEAVSKLKVTFFSILARFCRLCNFISSIESLHNYLICYLTYHWSQIIECTFLSQEEARVHVFSLFTVSGVSLCCQRCVLSSLQHSPNYHAPHLSLWLSSSGATFLPSLITAHHPLPTTQLIIQSLQPLVHAKWG